MKIFDFDEMTDRFGSGSYKWDSSSDPDMIPLWVADMDFRTAPAILEALKKRVEHGVFGYVKVGDSYYDALTGWFSRIHGWNIDRDKVIYTSGVVPAVSAVIKALTRPGDAVALQTPAYNCFFSCIRNNGCQAVANPLRRVETPTGFTYRLDLIALEKSFEIHKPKLLILCNPHNPSGRVWSRDELCALRDLCHAHGVRVISDEIHCELTHPGHVYIPYALIDPQAIVCCSPSKAFNIAGLQIANIIVPDSEIYRLVDRAINDNEVCDVNPFGVIALTVAYNDCLPWLEALKNYLDGNYQYLRQFISARMPNLPVCDSESTYLAWIDVTPLGMAAEEVEERAKRDSKVWVNAGEMYAGDGYIRINYACPRARLVEGLERFARAFGR